MATTFPDGTPIDPEENRRRMAAGELYYAFVPDLVANRRKCATAVRLFNNSQHLTRRERVQMWNTITQDETPLPPKADNNNDEEKDEALLANYPWIDGSIWVDTGYNVKVGKNVYIGPNTTWIDTCTISVGDRTLIGPNCSFYSATHPLDYRVRNGTLGPEMGKPITIGEDCWFGGNVTVLPGVTIGRAAVIGAACVVTKDVEPGSVVVGNPARVIKKVDLD